MEGVVFAGPSLGVKYCMEGIPSQVAKITHLASDGYQEFSGGK